MDSLETKVVDTILERTTDTITIDGKDYPIAPPTAGTLILVSELTAKFPVISEAPKNIYQEVLATAKDMKILGNIVATLILGAKRIKENRTVSVSKTTHEIRKWSWRKFRYVKENITETTEMLEVQYLAMRLIDEVSNATLLKIIAKRLGMMQVQDFFELTTFLSVANRLKATREVETASGE